ncbi:TonB-dependent receptor plug domain-containing protein [Caulobacter sp. KR2-114]|uniref:TonB-dependent receptor plug domain-containing protein n=1 Tax=Caulobacter sp. KR2-114 TaxID=3400912 RepID=UPI003C2DE983
MGAAHAHAQTAPGPTSAVEDLRNLSVDQLADIDVSSVRKTPEALSGAPAAIYVITHDDIVRSGALSLAEALRLAPNLQVEQASASRYVITARGLTGADNAQNFSNKLLVMVDGRTAYSPLFSGVYWDMQSTLLEDVERIEVISGPGATLWGANAVNGVINIITRKAADTQGLYLDAHAGDQTRGLDLRYGGHIGQALAFRVYAGAFKDYDSVTAGGARAHDRWSNPHGGFRLDWTASPRDDVTLEGDAYQGTESHDGGADEDIDGHSLLLNWTHAGTGGQTFQMRAFWDHTGRATEQGGGDFGLDTYDLDVQDSFQLGARNQVVWGGGMRASRYTINGTPSFYFTPPSRTLTLGDVFIQDSLAISPNLTLTTGIKLEDDPYSGAVALPSVRLGWTPSGKVLIWGAVSRAIRSPTPFDTDVVEKVGGAVLLTGDAAFRPETVTAYEVGGRFQPSPRLSFSVSAFYNRYDDLRSIEPGQVSFLPLRWGNRLGGHSYGLEAWGAYRVASWWRLTAGFNILEERFRFAPGASGILGVAQLGDDPEAQAQVRSSWRLGRVSLDATLRYVGPLPAPALPGYVELNSRLGWDVADHLQLYLSGFNLLHERHLERPGGDAIPRSFVAGLQWRF